MRSPATLPERSLTPANARSVVGSLRRPSGPRRRPTGRICETTRAPGCRSRHPSEGTRPLLSDLDRKPAKVALGGWLRTQRCRADPFLRRARARLRYGSACHRISQRTGPHLQLTGALFRAADSTCAHVSGKCGSRSQVVQRLQRSPAKSPTHHRVLNPPRTHGSARAGQLAARAEAGFEEDAVVIAVIIIVAGAVAAALIAPRARARGRSFGAKHFHRRPSP